MTSPLKPDAGKPTGQPKISAVLVRSNDGTLTLNCPTVGPDSHRLVVRHENSQTELFLVPKRVEDACDNNVYEVLPKGLPMLLGSDTVLPSTYDTRSIPLTDQTLQNSSETVAPYPALPLPLLANQMLPNNPLKSQPVTTPIFVPQYQNIACSIASAVSLITQSVPTGSYAITCTTKSGSSQSSSICHSATGLLSPTNLIGQSGFMLTTTVASATLPGAPVFMIAGSLAKNSEQTTLNSGVLNWLSPVGRAASVPTINRTNQTIRHPVVINPSQTGKSNSTETAKVNMGPFPSPIVLQNSSPRSQLPLPVCSPGSIVSTAVSNQIVNSAGPSVARSNIASLGLQAIISTPGPSVSTNTASISAKQRLLVIPYPATFPATSASHVSGSVTVANTQSKTMLTTNKTSNTSTNKANKKERTAIAGNKERAIPILRRDCRGVFVSTKGDGDEVGALPTVSKSATSTDSLVTYRQVDAKTVVVSVNTSTKSSTKPNSLSNEAEKLQSSSVSNNSETLGLKSVVPESTSFQSCTVGTQQVKSKSSISSIRQQISAMTPAVVPEGTNKKSPKPFPMFLFSRDAASKLRSYESEIKRLSSRIAGCSNTTAKDLDTNTNKRSVVGSSATIVPDDSQMLEQGHIKQSFTTSAVSSPSSREVNISDSEETLDGKLKEDISTKGRGLNTIKTGSEEFCSETLKHSLPSSAVNTGNQPNTADIPIPMLLSGMNVETPVPEEKLAGNGESLALCPKTGEVMIASLSTLETDCSEPFPEDTVCSTSSQSNPEPTTCISINQLLPSLPSPMPASAKLKQLSEHASLMARAPVNVIKPKLYEAKSKCEETKICEAKKFISESLRGSLKSHMDKVARKRQNSESTLSGAKNTGNSSQDNSFLSNTRVEVSRPCSSIPSVEPFEFSSKSTQPTNVEKNVPEISHKAGSVSTSHISPANNNCNAANKNRLTELEKKCPPCKVVLKMIPHPDCRVTLYRKWSRKYKDECSKACREEALRTLALAKGKKKSGYYDGLIKNFHKSLEQNGKSLMKLVPATKKNGHTTSVVPETLLKTTTQTTNATFVSSVQQKSPKFYLMKMGDKSVLIPVPNKAFENHSKKAYVFPGPTKLGGNQKVSVQQTASLSGNLTMAKVPKTTCAERSPTYTVVTMSSAIVTTVVTTTTAAAATTARPPKILTMNSHTSKSSVVVLCPPHKSENTKAPNVSLLPVTRALVSRPSPGNDVPNKPKLPALKLTHCPRILKLMKSRTPTTDERLCGVSKVTTQISATSASETLNPFLPDRVKEEPTTEGYGDEHHQSNFLPNVVIKAEPLNRGYSDEQSPQSPLKRKSNDSSSEVQAKKQRTDDEEIGSNLYETTASADKHEGKKETAELSGISKIQFLKQQMREKLKVLEDLRQRKFSIKFQSE